ncbi:MAG: penicillin acylase family protein [Fulvivirga sp.]|uniref:penicillin acylase family protein n=1 Tax=Fulvivirga sp. TaxID=1931237 RepID=UPI0032EAA028
MRVAKRIFLTLIIIIFIAGISITFYLSGLKPAYDGQLNLPNLTNEVKVHFDNHAIPHIYADNTLDAYKALGYVHAQERLFQMELMRRIAPGRLSEMFGKDLVETDKFFKTVGIHRMAKEEAQTLKSSNSKEYQLAQSYLDGVNHFINTGPTPLEFTLLGLDKEEYTVEDIYNVMGYISFSFAQAQKSDPIVTSIAKNLGPEYLADLDLAGHGNTEMIKNYPQNATLEKLTAKADEIMNSLPAPTWIGSNSWVVNPTKSATGSVIFANDPHMGFSQPCVWFEAHVVTPEWERYGYHAAMFPFALLLHNRNYAIGLTMFENDDIDFYYNVEPTETIKEEIKIKDAEPITIEVQVSEFGPIVSDVIDGLEDQPIAMWWTYLQTKQESMEAIYLLNHAKGMDDVRSGASRIKAPGLNVMYGDKDGNIAWWASAKLHLLGAGVERNHILNAKDSTHTTFEWLDFSNNPQAENTPWNYVYSTNNQPDSIKGGYYPGYYAPEDRALRITSLLERKEKISVDDYKAFFLENTSTISAKIAHEYAAQLEPQNDLQKEVKNLLADWDGSHSRESKAPIVYQKILYHSLRLAMENKLDSGQFEGWLNTHLMKRSFDPLFHNDSSKWWDDPSTQEKETRKQVFNKAFEVSLEELTAQLGDIKKWKWGNVHTLEHPHPIGKVELLRDYFNVGIFKMDASDAVLNKLSFTRTGSGLYPIKSGPSTRRLINFADIENSQSILPTGQSGNPLSDYYDDQAELYTKGKWRKMMMNKEEIEQKAMGTIVFKSEN